MVASSVKSTKHTYIVSVREAGYSYLKSFGSMGDADREAKKLAKQGLRASIRRVEEPA